MDKLTEEFGALAKAAPDWTLMGSCCAMWVRRESPPPPFEDDPYGLKFGNWVVGGGEQLMDHDDKLIAFLVFAYMHRVEIATALAALAERDRQLDAVRAIHKLWKVYGECDHDHQELGEPGVFDVDEIGYTCAYEYDVCGACCGMQFQSEECATNHVHGPGKPICPTIAALDAPKAGESAPAPGEEEG